jgi:outer membrane immunogenic protein
LQSLLIGISAVAVAFATTAGAADMNTPLKAPLAPAAPAWSWTGFYVGLNAGWNGINGAGMTSAPNDPATVAFNTGCITANACPQNYGSADGNGFIGGGQIGYNWQVQNWVVGLETDFQGTTTKASVTDSLPNGVSGFDPFLGTQSTRENYLGTVRGRFGVLATPTVLLYATGGYAYASVTRNWFGSFPTFVSAWGGSSTDVLSGWTVGTGLEWALGNGFTLAAEYLYVRLNGGNGFVTAPQDAGCVPGGVPSCQFRITGSDLNNNIVRAKLNYKF